MKFPTTPPKLEALLNQTEPKHMLELATIPATRESHYYHWDKVQNL